MTHIDMQSAHGQARLAVQGAQLLEADLAGSPLLWLSPLADFSPGKAVRGGVPLCFPWFGKHPEGLPAHGFARNRVWTVLEQQSDAVRLALDDDAQTRAIWPHRFHAELAVSLGEALAFRFVVENRDEQAFTFSYALHSYFRVTDLARCRVSGLDGRLRREVGHVTSPQCGDVQIGEAIDAIFEQAPADLLLQDGERRILIQADAMRSAVVWSPAAAGEAVADIGSHWRKFLCVERGNIGTAAITLRPGEVHQARMSIRLA
ncbi:D-hexose-6-phosphate mutarotase [Chitinimonas sp.]|uniref:D-hexose-6-phosphate mutarotase n=1 Tax=Chitinimonas sp. TaxID=1934313 RepID=UPI0035ADFCC4